MLDRDRETLTSWIDSLNRVDQTEKAQAQEESIGRKRRKELFGRGVQEDIEYLDQIGVIALFKDAAKILRRRWPDVKIIVDKPHYREDYTYSPYEGYVSVGLEWDYQLKKGQAGAPSNWQARRVNCRVERNKDSREIMGLYFADSGPKSICSEHEEIRQRILTGILEAKHGRTYRAPSSIRNIFAHVRNT